MEVADPGASEHPSQDDINEWHAYCFGSEEHPDSIAEDSGHIPRLEVVRSLNQVCKSNPDEQIFAVLHISFFGCSLA